MKNIFPYFFFLIFVISSCDDSDKYIDKEGKQSGEIIYQKECMICHGEEGNLGASDAANLRESYLNEEEMEEVIKKGKGDMQAFSHLTNEQVDLVVNYIRNELINKKKTE